MPNRLAIALCFLLAAVAPAFGASAAAPAVPTILPGSPLAALAATTAKHGASSVAAAAKPAAPGEAVVADNLGLTVVLHMVERAGGAFDGFSDAVRRGTDLGPIFRRLADTARSPQSRTMVMRSLGALAMVVGSAVMLETALRVLITLPRSALARRAVPRRLPEMPLPEGEPGLAEAEAGETEQMPRFRIALRAWLRRLPFAAASFILALIPVVAFTTAVTLWLSSGLISAAPSRLVVLETANAYLFCRVAIEVARFLFAPKAPSLRLVRASDRRAAWALIWVRVLFGSALFGSAIVRIATGFGLEAKGSSVLMRLIVLAVHVELAVLIWQSRRKVGRWIRGSGAAGGLWGALRRRFAALWWIVAMFYVLALWVVWVAGVPHAFVLMLRVVLVFMAVAAGARVAIFAGYRVLDRLLGADTEQPTQLPPAFSSRARAYHPLLRVVLQIIIAFIALAVLLQGWGLDVLPFLLANHLGRSLLSALVNIGITLVIAVVAWEVSTGWLNAEIEKLVRNGRMGRAARLRTLLPMLQATIGVVVVVVAGIVVLNEIGLNVAPLLAGAGVIGLAIGFGSQKLVQDIITGLFLLLEDTIQVGDVVSVGGLTGTVERLSIRTIRLRAGDGSMNVIPFSSVTTVTNMTREFGMAQISIGVAYGSDVDRVVAVMKDIAQTMRAEQPWSSMMRDDIQVFGLDQFEANAIMITGQIRTGPGQHWSVRREYNRRMKNRFAEEGIAIPAAGGPPVAKHIVFDPEQLEALRDALAVPQQRRSPALLPQSRRQAEHD